MAAEFQDSEAKRTVREGWNTPLLRYLHEKYEFRYRYFGLPGVHATDILLWKDMIDEIVAFERPSPRGDERRDILSLRTTLHRLGIPHVAYYGSFEEVVILGQDWEGQKYKQEHVITLYNLDFCDEISSKVRTRKEGQQLWRFEALRHVLANQAACFARTHRPTWFVFMLTVRDQMDAQLLASFLADDPYADTRDFCAEGSSIRPLPSTGPVAGSHTWGIKAFLHNTMRGYLTTPHVAALFFPVVKYQGGKGMTSPMLHWTIFCQFDDPTRSKPRFYPKTFLRDVCTVRAQADGTIVAEQQPGESGKNQILDAPSWFRQYARWFDLE